MRRLTDPTLWARIEALPLDAPGATRPFSAKLAEAEGWQQDDTARVIAEYRRFLYLTQVLDTAPAPSPAIDAAWKMHLTYTRSYWDHLVPDILHRPLHRDAEAARMMAPRRVFHRELKKAYAREFGADAPRNIWQHPMQPGFNGLLVMFFLGGFATAFLGGIGYFIISALIGADTNGPVDTLWEKIWTLLFLIGWAMAMFSPVWAWAVSRALPHIRTRKKPPPGTQGWSFGISFSRS